MDAITALIRLIFNTILFVVAILGALVIAFFYVNGLEGDSRLTIGSGSTLSRSMMATETRTLYRTLQARADEINRPVSNSADFVSFRIDAGETALHVAENLRQAGLIADASLFGQLLRYNGVDTQLKTGDYILRRNMTMREVGEALYSGRSALTTLTIPPGWRAEQLAEHLSTTGTMDGHQFLKQVRRGNDLNHFLLADLLAGQSLEGYLFPGTYYVPDNATPKALITGMLNSMARALPPDTLSLAQQQGLTLQQVIILASIVEREAAIDEERPLIASVYLNRLQPTSSETHLRADPTVQYAMGYQSDRGQWWKSPVQLEEYPLVDSPYNTYLYPGLPPGPIANPGIASILAVLRPAQTNYLFFVCRYPGCAGGEHVFAATYDEHLQNVAVYWGE